MHTQAYHLGNSEAINHGAHDLSPLVFWRCARKLRCSFDDWQLDDGFNASLKFVRLLDDRSVINPLETTCVNHSPKLLPVSRDPAICLWRGILVIYPKLEVPPKSLD